MARGDEDGGGGGWGSAPSSNCVASEGQRVREMSDRKRVRETVCVRLCLKGRRAIPLGQMSLMSPAQLQSASAPVPSTSPPPNTSVQPSSEQCQ